jgi:hypothetical protein
MRKAGKGRRHWNYLNECNKRACDQTLTFVGALNACASVLALEEGRCVHQQQIIQHGLESDVFVESSFMDMYAKCGTLEDA